jgi:hypothetical protein
MLEWTRCGAGMLAGVISREEETESREFCLKNETGADCVGAGLSGSEIRRFPSAASLCATDNGATDDGELPTEEFVANGEDAFGPSCRRKGVLGGTAGGDG